jgi:2-C-methyl-D-erythritol 4-phosphate cytidylyltransferase
MRVEKTKLVVKPGAGRNGRLARLVYQFDSYSSDVLMVQDACRRYEKGSHYFVDYP